MASIKHEAKMANGRSHRCKICPVGYVKCNLEMMRVCSDNFIEGFIKGAKFMKKRMKED